VRRSCLAVGLGMDEVPMLTTAAVSPPIRPGAGPATARLAAAVAGRRAAEDPAAAAAWRRGWKDAVASAVEKDGTPWTGLTEAVNAFTASAPGPVVIAADSTMACYYGVQTGWTARRGDRKSVV